MTTFILPIAHWSLAPADATITQLTSSIQPGHVVASMANGQSWILSVDRSLVPYAIRPKVLLVGHHQAIRTAVVATQDVDVGAADEEEVVVTASENGGVAIWNMMDGQCLQTSARAFDGVPLVMQAAAARNLLFIGGCNNHVLVLDSRTMEVACRSPNMNNWITSLVLVSTDDPARLRLLTLDYMSVISEWSFNSDNLTFAPLPIYSIDLLQMDGGVIHPSIFYISLKLCRSNSALGIVIGKRSAKIFRIDMALIVILSQVDSPPLGGSWVGGDFLNNDTIILWTQFGIAHIYKIQSKKTHLLTTFNHDKKEHMTAVSCYVYWLESPMFVTTRNNGGLTEFTLFDVLPDHMLEKQVDAIAPFQSFTFMDIWPLKTVPTNDITAYAMCGNDTVVQASEMGELSLDQLKNVFSGKSNNQRHRVKIHQGRVNALLVTEGGKYVVSGGADCVVQVLSLPGLELLGSFTAHPTPIMTLQTVPTDAGIRMRSCVIAISVDHSMSVLSLEELSTLYYFSGHAHPIVEILWRTREDYLLIACADDTLYVWQLQLGQLDRILYGAAAKEVLEYSGDCRIRICRTIDLSSMSFKSSLSCFPVTHNQCPTALPSLHVFMTNVKRAITSSVANSTNTTPVTISAQLVSASLNISHPSLAIPPIATPITPSTVTPKKSETMPSMTVDKSVLVYPSTIAHPGVAPLHSAVSVLPSHNALNSSTTPSYSLGLDCMGSPSMSSLAPTTNIQLAKSLFSALITWGVDITIDEMTEQQFHLQQHLSNVTIGLRGVGGNLSILAPTGGTGLADWSVSPTVTAARLLAIVAVLRSIFNLQGREQEAVQLLSQYITKLPAAVGKNYCYPSLAFLARYWQDSSCDIQQAARCLFIEALTLMPNDRKVEIVLYWGRHLPSIASSKEGLTKTMARAAIILGVLGSEYPECLPQKMAKEVALSLTLLLNEEHAQKAISRLAACELLGKGFTTWEPYVNGSAVVRSLIAHTLQSTAPGLTSMAKQALYYIALANISLLVQTIIFDLVHLRGMLEKTGLMKLISSIMHKNPLLLYSFIPRIAEAVVHVLDPSLPGTREASIQATTALLYDLVKRYPSVAFHGGTQRLAVGTLEGSTVLYDLKTATRWQMLEGHTGAISCVCFSGDGKQMATFSTNEGNLRFWQPSTGFFGALASTLSGTAGNGNNLKSYRTVHITNSKHSVHLPNEATSVPPQIVPLLVSTAPTPSSPAPASGLHLPPDIFNVKLEFSSDGKSVMLNLPSKRFSVPL